jgi:hypothetical protein
MRYRRNRTETPIAAVRSIVAEIAPDARGPFRRSCLKNRGNSSLYVRQLLDPAAFARIRQPLTRRNKYLESSLSFVRHTPNHRRKRAAERRAQPAQSIMQSTQEALDLARIQFAFTVSFHIVFPALSIGLASFIAVLEGAWLKTGKPVYKELCLFWSRVFAVAFGMGVVSGVVMSYEFGTNWGGFSSFAGPVTGPLLTYEVMTAFFLEAGFLGIMLFGWNKVGRKAHFGATLMVAIGTLISTFFII